MREIKKVIKLASKKQNVASILKKVSKNNSNQIELKDQSTNLAIKIFFQICIYSTEYMNLPMEKNQPGSELVQDS